MVTIDLWTYQDHNMGKSTAEFQGNLSQLLYTLRLTSLEVTLLLIRIQSLSVSQYILHISCRTFQRWGILKMLLQNFTLNVTPETEKEPCASMSHLKPKNILSSSRKTKVAGKIRTVMCSARNKWLKQRFPETANANCFAFIS